MRAHFTPQAEIDLEEVGDYIALDNPRRAVSFIREIREHREKIADGPALLRGASRLGQRDTDLRASKLPDRLRAVR
jgi:toxin ParE1/3/4